MVLSILASPGRLQRKAGWVRQEPHKAPVLSPLGFLHPPCTHARTHARTHPPLGFLHPPCTHAHTHTHRRAPLGFLHPPCTYTHTHTHTHTHTMLTWLSPPSGQNGVSHLLDRIAKCIFFYITISPLGFPGGASGKESALPMQRDAGLIPGSGRSPGRGNGYPLQGSGLGNPMDRRPWWATDHGVTESRTRLSTAHLS